MSSILKNFSVAITLAILAFTQAAWAQEVTDYAALQAAAAAGETGDIVLGGDITDGATQLTIERDLTLDLNGHTLTITLPDEDGSTLNGIKIANNVTLTIQDSDGSGVLNITHLANMSATQSYGAAINTTDGVLIIESGTVNAKGGGNGAGIGGGGKRNGGTTIINGGIVTAIGGGGGGDGGGAGIGGGGEGNGGEVIISGGTVIATGRQGGAGIGGGYYGVGGKVTISGGAVTATGSGGAASSGAGIGGGSSRNGGEVIISGGVVTATGGGGGGTDAGGAGIGGGGDGNGGKVTITGGVVTATGGEGSECGGTGIGGGGDGNGAEVIISGGSVKATGIGDADDIGKGGEWGNSGTLKNDEGADVFLNTLTVSGQNNATVTNATYDGVEYLTNGVKTDASGKLYFYLPISSGAEQVSVEIDEDTYVANYTRAGNHNNEAELIKLILQTISYNANSGTGTMPADEVMSGTDYTIKANAFTKINYVFTGWNTQADGEGTPYAAGAKIDNVTEDITLYAQWEINSYTVSFKILADDEDDFKTETVNHGDDAPAPTDPERTGHTFDGWDKVFTNVTSDLIVVAQWTINSYTVTFLDGEDEFASEDVDHGSKVSEPDAPTKEGYNFAGWFDENGDEFDFGTPIIEAITLTAKWNETTPIIAKPHTLYPIPHTPVYYNLRGQPLGTQKPTVSGVYIEKRPGVAKRIVVR